MKRISNSRIGILVFLLVIIPSFVSARSFTKIVAFGDSLSDHGGLVSYLGLYDPDTNPNGALEVWSNGNTWVEYFAAEMGAALDNNAIAGAMTKGHENSTVQALSDAGSLPQLGFVGQVQTYLAGSPTIEADTTLFVVLIGGNDLLAFGRGDLATADPAVMVQNAMTNISQGISGLYAAGARNFLILNLPNIGSTPLYNARDFDQRLQATLLTLSFNSGLSSLITSLQAALAGATLYSFDLYGYLDTMIQNGFFNNSTGSYMVLDSSGNRTGQTNEPAEDYLFWDSIHPTTKAHENLGRQVAALFADDDSSCFIMSLQMDTAGNGLLSLF